MTENPLIISLIQLTEPMLQFVNLPYAAALLQAFVKKNALLPERYLFTLPLFERLPFEIALQRLSLSHVAGFSLYVWNAAYTLALAQKLKARQPETLIVVGGPHVPDRAEAFMQQYPWIDVCVHGEGEATFLALLEQFPDRDYADLNGISYRAGKQIITRPKQRARNLERVASAFLSGILEPLLLNHPHNRWLSVWETNRGCPFSCSFCDWGSLTNAKVLRFDLERLEAELRWFGQQKIEVIYCCDANFGIFERDLEIAKLAAAVREEFGYPRLFYTQTAKNATERVFESQEILFKEGMHTGTTLSMQSVSPQALSAIRRENISLKSYQELQSRFRQAGIPTYTDVLVGLPGETVDSFKQGVGTLIQQGQHQEMRFYNVYILPNAELADPDYRKEHGIKSVKLPYVPPHSQVQAPPEGILEWQEMVIAAQSFSPQDWQEMRIFAWMTHILYFSRVLQLPMMLFQQYNVANYATVLSYFCETDLGPEYPILKSLRQFLSTKSAEILAGGGEYCAGQLPNSPNWVWLESDYFALTQLLYSPRLIPFLDECEQLLHSLYSQAPRKLDSGKLDSEELALSALQEALALSRDLFCSQLPGRQQFSRELHWNLWDVYQGVLRGEPLSLEPGLWLFKGQRESAQMLHFKSVCLQAPHVHQLRESQGQLQL
jgi:radical SAM superfamily enzyme YgiQ (UPF0313 family)